MKKAELLNALCNMVNDIGDRIDGEDDRPESEFLHDICDWIQDLLLRCDP